MKKGGLAAHPSMRRELRAVYHLDSHDASNKCSRNVLFTTITIASEGIKFGHPVNSHRSIPFLKKAGAL
jgi:hypothetical protein